MKEVEHEVGSPTHTSEASIQHDPSENWPFSFGGPRCRPGFWKGETKFIPKYDFCAQPLRLFLALENLAPARPSPTLAPVLLPAAKAFVG